MAHPKLLAKEIIALLNKAHKRYFIGCFENSERYYVWDSDTKYECYQSESFNAVLGMWIGLIMEEMGIEGDIDLEDK